MKRVTKDRLSQFRELKRMATLHLLQEVKIVALIHALDKDTSEEFVSWLMNSEIYKRVKGLYPREGMAWLNSLETRARNLTEIK